MGNSLKNEAEKVMSDLWKLNQLRTPDGLKDAELDEIMTLRSSAYQIVNTYTDQSSRLVEIAPENLTTLLPEWRQARDNLATALQADNISAALGEHIIGLR